MIVSYTYSYAQVAALHWLAGHEVWPAGGLALVILTLDRDRLVLTHVQDRVAALRDFQERAIGVAHQSQFARVHVVQRAIVVGPVQLITVAVEVHRVLLDRILSGC